MNILLVYERELSKNDSLKPILITIIKSLKKIIKKLSKNNNTIIIFIIIIIIIKIIKKSLFNTHKKDLCTVLHLKRIKFVP